MSFSHVLSQTTVVESTSIVAPKTYYGVHRVSVDKSGNDKIAIGTNTQVNIPDLDVSEIQSIRIQSDVDCTIKTNSSGSPDDTLDLVAGVPYIWNTDSYDSLLLTVDVTTIYVTNAAACTLKIEALIGAVA